MANKDFKDYAIAGSNVTLTYDDINDTVTFAAQGNVQSVNGETGVVVLDTQDITDSTNKRYVTDAQLVVVGNTSGTNTGDNATNSQYSGLAASKQDTLVSGTNIKTINSQSLLGSGDIAISTPPSGVAGAIQFSNGSAFASDAANLFWDDTNDRLGLGINAPTSRLHIKGSGATSATTSLLVQNSAATDLFKIADNGSVTIGVVGASSSTMNGTYNFVSNVVVS